MFSLVVATMAVSLSASEAWAKREPKIKTVPKIEMAGDEKKDEKVKKTGIVITTTSGEWDKVADEAGQIYVSRGYKGVVPGVRDESVVPAKKHDPEVPPAERPVLSWIGFQPFATYSRVFLQLTGDFKFTVTKPKPERIEVRIPGTDISTPNDVRHLDTRQFPTTVKNIVISRIGEEGADAVVSIYLKKPVGYLYRQEGEYIFVDIGL